MSLADQLVDPFVKVNTTGNFINNGGKQCVAVFNQQERDIVRGGWIGTPITGFAKDLWTQFGTDADYNNYVKVGADQRAQKGDSAIWNNYGGGNSLSHVALVLEDQGSHLLCFTQTPTVPAHTALLTKVGLAGYLRPKKFIVAAPVAATPSQSNETVASEVIAGTWGNNPERAARLKAAGYDPNTIQSIVNARLATPIAPAPQPAPAPVSAAFNVGDVVVPTSLVDYNGTPMTQWDPSYTITEVIGDRAVLSARGAVWAAFHTANIRKV